jgi:hypothetical protein
VKSPITNDGARPRRKLDVERAFLYRPETEWTYSHHPFLAFFDGRYVAMWSNGRRDEDAPAQRVLMSTSRDFRAWTPPTPIADSMMGRETELVLTAAGFHRHDGRLIAYVGQYEYAPDVVENGRRPKRPVGFRNAALWAITTTDLITWSAPIRLGLPMVPNIGPEPTDSGRLLISGGFSFPYTDDRSGLAGWRVSGPCPTKLTDICDHQQGWHRAQERAGWPVGLCEGSWFQTDDGTIHMLLRSGTHHLWVTESRDDGATWSDPAPTGFTNGISKFHCGRLPDGRCFVVGNPDPAPGRNPLAVSLSADGVRFDRELVLADEHYEMKRPGMHKGGEYGYPHTLIRDGYLHTIVSRQKEAVEVLRVELDALR